VFSIPDKETNPTAEIDAASLSLLAHLMIDFFRYSTRIAGKRLVGNITIAQMLILWKIEAGFNKVGALAEKLRITPAAVSKMVDSLVEAELLVRIRSEEDRRVLTLKATDQGRQIFDQNKKMMKEIMLDGFGALNPEEVETFIVLLTKVITRYDLKS
jgi:DNA-binding MarR family transcriptional regulator